MKGTIDVGEWGHLPWDLQASHKLGRKGLFFDREESTKLERAGCKELGWGRMVW